MMAATAGGGMAAWRRTSARLSADSPSSPASRNAISVAVMQITNGIPPIRANPLPPPAQQLIETPRCARIFVRVEARDPKLSFEAALGKVDSVVEAMESGDVPLADLLAKFEQGTQLLKVCETRLKDAEMRIEVLKKQRDGSVAFEKFEAARED